jgi:hypothetical protein
MKSKTIKAIAALILLTGFALLGSGCVTVGYDFIKQQATVTFDAKTVKEPTK